MLRDSLKLITNDKANNWPTAIVLIFEKDGNYKYVNKQFRNPVVAERYVKVKGLKELLIATVYHVLILNFYQEQEEESPLLHFAKGAMKGKYDDHQVFLGLVHAMVHKVDHEKHGVGMQNFLYAPTWEEFTHIVSIHSPQAHKFLSAHFQAPTMHTFQ